MNDDPPTDEDFEIILRHMRKMKKKEPEPPLYIKNEQAFKNCNHVHKDKAVEFHRCADCGYHFAYDNLKYSHPDQYKDCEHSVKGDVFGTYLLPMWTPIWHRV